jgi:hypothetical protein
MELDTEAQMVASILAKQKTVGATHVLIDIPVGPTAKLRSLEAVERLAALFRTVAEQIVLRVEVVVCKVLWRDIRPCPTHIPHWCGDPGMVRLPTGVTRAHTDTQRTLKRKVCLQLRLREDHRQDRYFPFPQGCDGLLERPGIDPKVMQQGDHGALVGALIG